MFLRTFLDEIIFFRYSRVDARQGTMDEYFSRLARRHLARELKLNWPLAGFPLEHGGQEEYILRGDKSL